MHPRSRDEDDRRARQLALELLGKRAPPPREPTARVERPEAAGPDYRKASLFVQWLDGLLRIHKATAFALAEGTVAHATAEEPAEADDDIARALGKVHRMLMAHPVATKAVVRALLVEGRRHARTPRGAALRERLAASAEIHRASMLWRTLSLDMFDDETDGELPSTYVDHLLRVVDLANPASVLGGLFVTEER